MVVLIKIRIIILFYIVDNCFIGFFSPSPLGTPLHPSSATYNNNNNVTKKEKHDNKRKEEKMYSYIRQIDAEEDE